LGNLAAKINYEDVFMGGAGHGLGVAWDALIIKRRCSLLSIGTHVLVAPRISRCTATTYFHIGCWRA
jgi:hypothetical protein